MIWLKEKSKARLSFYLIIIFGFILVSLFIIFSFQILPRAIFIIKNSISRVEMACGCINKFIFSDHFYLNSLILLGGLLFLVILLIGLFRIIKLWITTNHQIRNIVRNKIILSPQLLALSKEIGLENKIIEVKTNLSEIFCFGFLNPRICLASKIKEKLTEDELKAVLLHEKSHLINRDPLKIFIIESLVKIFFFIPAIKAVLKNFRAFSELEADSLATDNFRNKQSLSRALIKVITLQYKSGYRFSPSIIRFSSITNLRIDKLLDSSKKVKIKLFPYQLLVSILVSFFILGIIIKFTPATEAHNSSHHSCDVKEEIQICPQKLEPEILKPNYLYHSMSPIRPSADLISCHDYTSCG